MNRARSQGVALISAVFLIVVLGGTVFAVSLVSITQSISSATELESREAYFAARARLEEDIDIVLDMDQGAGCPRDSADPDVDRGEVDLFGFTTTMGCIKAQNIKEGGKIYDVLTLTVTAFKGSREAGTRVRREVRVQICRSGKDSEC
jgi:hypothetical protein